MVMAMLNAAGPHDDVARNARVPRGQALAQPGEMTVSQPGELVLPYRVGAHGRVHWRDVDADLLIALKLDQVTTLTDLQRAAFGARRSAEASAVIGALQAAGLPSRWSARRRTMVLGAADLTDFSPMALANDQWRILHVLPSAARMPVPRTAHDSVMVALADGAVDLRRTCGSAAVQSMMRCLIRRLKAVLPGSIRVSLMAADRLSISWRQAGLRTRLGVTQGMLARIVATTCRAQALPCAGHAVPVTLSIGIMTEAGAGDPAVREAEGLAERAAGLGGDRILEDDRRYRREAGEGQAPLSHRVAKALNGDGLRLVYQPIRDTGTGQVMFNEALMRLVDDDGSLLKASDVMPVIHGLGLSRLLDRKVLVMALDRLRADPGLRLSINVTGVTLGDPDWLDICLEVLGLDASIAARLIVEVTETHAIDTRPEIGAFLSALRAVGVRIALDDFGSGYGSFRHLRDLPFDMIKIDGSFVRDLTIEEADGAFIRSIVTLARDRGLATVAEFVENEETALLLRAAGVMMIQGHHCGRPSAEAV